ncbi:MAG: gliding motility-associated C-terminal domain-containing protein [Bacteroidota bacterium]|nr:gliding motility-associated C-terminal domain-containing protein [Bacteroidota bacterium]
MSFKSRALTFLIIALTSAFSAKAQTLYWIGGSGNFNDGKHWSLSSGGKSANLTPNENLSAIFDNFSSNDASNIVITFVGENKCNGLKFINTNFNVVLNSNSSAVLNQYGNLEFNGYTKNFASFQLNLKSNNSETKNFNPYLETFKGPVVFKSGTWNLHSITVDSPNYLSFESGKYNTSASVLRCCNLFINKEIVEFNSQKTFAVVSNAWDVNKLINADKNLKIISSSKNLNNKNNVLSVQKLLVCSIQYTAINAPCAGGSGSISFTIDPTCAPGPYTVDLITGASCIPIQTVIPGPMVVTYTNISGCGANSLDLFVTDGTGAVITNTLGQALPVDPTPVNISIIATTQPSCAGQCNGFQRVRFIGGAAPYTVQVSPTTGPASFTTGAVTINTVTGLCGGAVTYSLTDSKGCVFVFSSFIPPTPPIALTVNSSSVSCNNGCNGTFSITPSGGTPNYTINFSAGTTSIVSPAQTASIGGLCPAVYSATITDSKSCATTTNVTITQPPPLTVTPTQTNVSCNSVCNGIASVFVSGGTSPYTYTWSPGPGSTSSLTSLCAGTQTVIIRDNNFCTQQQTFNITQPTSITITPTITNVFCNALCNGSGSVSATGGTGPITFTWVAAGPSTISTTSLIAGQCAGNFTIFANDGNTCTVSSTIAITQPPALTLTALTQSIACFGQCTGASTANVSGGNGAPFSFTWSPGAITGQGTATVSNLCSGNYSLAVVDASNCPINTTISITQPSSITPNVSSTSITCNGLCNGVINAAPVGGILPYSYTLVTPGGATVTTAPPFTGLCGGTHTLIIRDLSNCSQTFTINVAQPNLLVASVNSTSLTCFNVCNGSLAGNVIGGTPGYTLSWNTPGGPVAGGVLGGLCAGTYTFLATDFNGCTTNSIVTLSEPPQITATINVTNPLCNTLCNGLANAGVGGGTPGYTLNWSNGFTGNPNTGLCAGNYTLNVIDINGCTNSFTTSLVAPSPLTLTINSSSASCAGSCDGSATVTATGGSPGYTYQFNTLPFPTTNTTGILGGFCAGGYIVSATDINGCSQSVPFTINQPIALSVALTGLQTSCNACTGAATVSMANGTPTYAVAWTNTLGAVVSSNSVATNLCPGNYTATATDSKGCTATTTANIAQTVTVTVVSGGGGIQCFGACTASATANALGGTLPYSYTWAVTAQTAQTAVNLCAGNYTVTASDALGCSNTSTISFVDPPDITLTPTQTNVSCFGVCNGAINSNAVGGTGALTYSWSPGGITTPNVSGLCAGTYTLRVTDGNGCNKTQTFAIVQSPSITATFTTTNPSACVVNNGSICATPSGGSGAGYTFTWSPAGGTGINTSCYSNLTAGAYSLIVADGAGCTATLNSLITNPSGPTLTAVTTSVNCFGGNTGVISVTATGTPAFSFTWSPAVGFINVGNTTSAINLTSGNYNLSSTDGNGCITSQTFAVTEASSLTVTSSIHNLNCNGICNGSITLIASGGTPGYNFNWIPAASITIGQGTGTVSSLCAGNYSVNITDANACINTLTFNVVQPAALTINTISSNVTCNGACNGTATALAAGGTGVINYTWPAVGAFTGSNTANVFNLCPAIYSVIATDANLCTATNTIQITQPPALTSTLNLINATCSSSCNAVATHSVSGGTPLYNFSWSSGGATTSTLGSLCAGNYTATVTDANGCVTAQAFTVIAPAPFTGTLTPQNPLCNAACNGSISTTLSGAQGAVGFVWIPTGAGQNPTGLCANNYTLIATDANGCQFLGVTNLTQPAALLANVTSTNPACNGNCNGIAISIPANAQGAVNYTWTPAAPNSATVNALCAGNYSVLVQDANGCQDQQTFTLTNPPALTVNSSVGPSSCGSPNGSITVIAVGGTPNYTYTWGPPIVSTNSTVVGLAAGIYTVTVSDSQNCTNTLSIPLSNANGPNATPIISSSISCNGQCTGAASINIAGIVGGTPGYTVSWIAPPSASTVNPQTNLCAGSYTAQITDQLSCVLFTAVTISQPTPINILPNVGLPICNGICNGSISLNPSGGVGPYSFTWSPANPGGGISTYTNACAGNYTVVIEDNNLCPSTQTLNLPAVLNMVAVINSTNNICFGNCNGISSVISLAGGTPPFSYSWNNGQSGSVANNLCNGTYSVIVTDANSCNNTFTSAITSPAQITANTTVNQPLCGICNGSSTITAVGGTAPLSYTWTNGSNSTIANGLCGGLYAVTIEDVLGCQVTQTVPVNNSTGITSEIQTLANEQCFASCNGAATVQAIGGTAPITYNWLGPIVSNSVITNLCSGTYFLQMTDALGCVRNTSVTIGAAIQLTVSPFITAPTACLLNNGSINVIVSGGFPGYTYAWLPSAATTSFINGVGAGSYTLTVTDSSPGACSQTNVFSISNITGPTVTSTLSNVNCFGACTGSINAVGTSTALPISYQWSNGATTSFVTGLCSGVITLTVTDGNLCKTINTFTIDENPQLQIGALAIQQPICGLCNGGSTVSAIGGIAPYTYTWSSGSNLATSNGLCAGLYQITIDDNLGCQTTQTIIINNSSGITGETQTINNEQCFGSCNGSATVLAVGGTAPITYNWLGPVVSNSVITNLCGGTYFLQMTDAVGCIRNTSITINSAIQLTVTPNITAPSCGLTNGTISVVVSGGAPAYSYTWVPSGITTPTLNNIGIGTYTINVTDTSPCTQSSIFTISNLTGPVVTSTISNIDCFGACTGSINAVGTSTALPISYLWSNGANTSSVTGLCSGVITLTVTDINLCSTVESYTITENPQINIGALAIQQPACGLCNGGSTVSALGGTAPYTYTWSSGSTTSNASGLCAGLYQVTIDDIFGCEVTQTLIINNSSGITSDTHTITNEQCFGSCNGAATVQAIGGTAPISYSWITPAISSNSIVTGLCGGSNYFVQMTDAAGCIRTASVGINSATQLTLTPTITSPSCTLPNGTINVVPSGGSPTYSFSWLPAGNTSSLTNIPAGSYTLTVTDNNLCSQTQIFNVNNITGPLITSTVSNINCFNACTGSIIAIGTTTALPVIYNWSNGATTPSVNGLCSGVITLTVTDNNGCETIQSFTVTENPQINIGALAIQQPACGLCNGGSTVSALGGTAPYSYTWSSGSTTASTSSLCAGLYQVTIDDVLGCQVTQTLVINNSSGITADTQTVTNEQCFGSCNGSATVVAVGGTAPISYNWLTPAVSSNSIVTGLCGGSAYFVQMTDAAGCIRNASVTINSAIQLTLTPTINSPSCTLPNGTINVVPSGGSPTYTFAWFPTGNTSSLTNIPAGSYTLTVTDNNLCSQTQVFNVNNITGPLITSTIANIDCFNTCTGSITALGTTTALPVSYHWSNGATTSTVTGLCSGVITLTVTDNNGCETIQSFTLTENPQIAIGALGIQQPSCNMCNGGSTVTALGIAPFSYTWTNGSAVNTASNLCAGLYQVSITDGLGCNATQNVIINNSNGITGETTAVQNELCFGNCNGGATVTAIGGTAPISYSWTAPSSTNNAVSGLCAGGYFVQMTDAQGCIRSTSININSATHLTLTPFVSLPNCTPGNNGTINVVPTGGTPAYNFTWSTGATTSSLTNIGAGSYTLTVTDNNLCSQNQVFNVNNITGPFVTAVQSNINCFNACTGSITTNGTSTALPISYLWSNGATTSSITGLCSGVITLTVTDGNLCKTITSYTITDNSDIQFSLPNLQLPLCSGSCNGTITLIPSGGVLPYTYSWSPVTSTLNPLTALCSGTYVAMVTDSKGCAKSQTVSLSDPPLIAVTSTLNNSSCSTVADGSASVTINGGTPVYNYNWSGPSAFTSTLQNISNILSGTYSLNVTDNNGCSSLTTLTVVPTITITADAGNNATVCPTSSIVLTGTNSAGAVAYNWYLLPNITNTIANTSTVIVPNTAGTSSFVLQTISSVSTCVAFDTVVVNLFPLPLVDAGPSFTIPVFTSTTIGGNPTSVAGNTFTWSPPFTLDNPSLGNPVASNTVNTTYTVTVTDAVTGCTASDTTQVQIYPEIVIPNGFSPNGDGKNDKWVIDNIQQFPDNVVEVYNRWGERLFIKTTYNGEFDGRFRNKDLPVGTYYYIINLNHPAYPKAYTGPLTIFR